MNKNISKLILIGIVMALIAGCDSKETVADIDKKAVDRWNALIAGDYEKAYSYIAPSYRELEDVLTYQMRIKKAQLNIKWNSVTFESKDCKESACTVAVDINYTYQFSRRSFGESTANTLVKENWIQDDGKWYYLPKEGVEL